MSESAPLFAVGDRVTRKGSDYHFPGIVVACFRKLTADQHNGIWRAEPTAMPAAGGWRYVIQDDRGTLFIQSDKTLEAL